jgi:hypothetical protein
LACEPSFGDESLDARFLRGPQQRFAKHGSIEPACKDVAEALRLTI